MGAALLKGELFLLRKQSSKLEVYDFSEYGFIRELKVNKLVAAVDICCCKKNNCLYIMDKKIGDTLKEVLKITADGKLLLNWQTKNNTAGHLSVTTEGNLIVTVQERHMIYEYSPDGDLKNDFKLSECRNPWHAIEKDKDLYVVCHGSFLDPLHRVCLVSRVGKTGLVEKSFGGKNESNDRQLEVPYYLAVGSLGYIIVAEPFHNRIVLIDKKLKLKAKIVPKCNGGFRYPRRVYLDEKNKKLVVIAAGDTMKGDSGKGTGDDDTSKENHGLMGKTEEETMKDDTDQKKISKDWRVLVFNMEPLLKKYIG